MRELRSKFSSFVLVISMICCMVTLSGFCLVPLASAEVFSLPCTITTTGNAWNGQLAFGLFQYNSSNSQQIDESYLVVMDTNGSVLHLLQSSGQQYFGAVKYIAQDTLMVQGANSPTGSELFFWNFTSNQTTYFPGIYGHHDVDYDPVNNTFLTLHNYVRNVNGTNYLFDTIVEVNATGSVLWSWDTYGHIPLSEADPFNDTAVVNGQTVIDFTHSNAIEWDYKDNIIYLNVRHTNTFYKIDQNTGNIVWACGQFGNFTLINSQGQQVSSLWYHSHDTHQIAPDVFIMFDNDFHNETNPLDARSRILEVTLNEKTMTAKETWSWESPPTDWSQYWGSADVLPNGDRIGVFGDPTHEFGQQGAQNTTGAVVVEVNQKGDVVRTYTFPAGWGIYRVTEIGSQSEQLATSGLPPPSQNTALVDVSFLAAAVAIAAIVAIVIIYLKRRTKIAFQGQINSDMRA